MDDTLTTWDNKTNQPMSPIRSCDKVHIVHKHLNNMRSTSQCKILYMGPEKYETLMMPQARAQSQPSLSRIDNFAKAKAQTSVRKTRRTYHLPGKKKKSSDLQIFKTSDRISYGFNKLEPFSVGAKKSITDMISAAQKKDKNPEPERRLIKANNYYQHNFLMPGNKNTKSTMM